jgi:hypothetical protein
MFWVYLVCVYGVYAPSHQFLYPGSFLDGSRKKDATHLDSYGGIEGPSIGSHYRLPFPIPVKFGQKLQQKEKSKVGEMELRQKKRNREQHRHPPILPVTPPANAHAMQMVCVREDGCLATSQPDRSMLTQVWSACMQPLPL